MPQLHGTHSFRTTKEFSPVIYIGNVRQGGQRWCCPSMVSPVMLIRVELISPSSVSLLTLTFCSRAHLQKRCQKQLLARNANDSISHYILGEEWGAPVFLIILELTNNTLFTFHLCDPSTSQSIRTTCCHSSIHKVENCKL